MYDIQIYPIKILYRIAEEADLSECAAIVSSSYEADRSRLNGFLKLLLLAFDDVGEGGNNAFNADLANEVRIFLDSLPDNTDTLFVCCDYGESRSAAMAAAIMRYKGADEMKVWRNPKYHPNVLVYGTLCEALGVPISHKEISEREEISRKAFRGEL